MALDSQTIPDGPIWARESVTNRCRFGLVPSGATSKQVPVADRSLIGLIRLVSLISVTATATAKAKATATATATATLPSKAL